MVVAPLSRNAPINSQRLGVKTANISPTSSKPAPKYGLICLPCLAAFMAAVARARLASIGSPTVRCSTLLVFILLPPSRLARNRPAVVLHLQTDKEFPLFLDACERPCRSRCHSQPHACRHVQKQVGICMGARMV